MRVTRRGRRCGSRKSSPLVTSRSSPSPCGLRPRLFKLAWVELEAHSLVGLASAVQALEGSAYFGVGLLASLRVLPRLPCPTPPTGILQEGVSALPSPEALDRLMRLAAVAAANPPLPSAMTLAIAEHLASKDLSSLGDDADGEIRLGVHDALAETLSRSLPSLESLEDLGAAAQALASLLARALDLHYTTVKRAVGAVWPQCDSAALMEESQGSDPSKLLQLERRTALVLRVGRDQWHLSTVRGSLGALHKGIMALLEDRREEDDTTALFRSPGPPAPASVKPSARLWRRTSGPGGTATA